MNKKRKRQNLFTKAKQSLDFWTEAVILEFTEELSRVMHETAVTSAQLAERIGTSPAYVSKVLSGNANPSLATMTKFARALECAVHIHLADEHAVVTWSDRPSRHVPQDFTGIDPNLEDYQFTWTVEPVAIEIGDVRGAIVNLAVEAPDEVTSSSIVELDDLTVAAAS